MSFLFIMNGSFCSGNGKKGRKVNVLNDDFKESFLFLQFECELFRAKLFDVVGPDLPVFHL